jgi:methylmalonyl-CoA/ethylmalonyl-CoA epimerase
MSESSKLDPGLFTAIDHVGVAVPDFDAAVALYRDTFGMELVHEETNEEQGVHEAMMAVGSSGSCVQILAPLTPESTIAKFLDRSGQGLQQVAYRVENVDTVCATLRERGVRLLYPEPKRGTAGSRINFVHPRAAGGVLGDRADRAPPGSHGRRRGTAAASPRGGDSAHAAAPPRAGA